MTYQTMLYEQKDGVAVITLSRPHVLNAANGTMLQELNQVIQQIKTDAAVRAVILTGAGRGFCSGADLANLGAGVDPQNPVHVRDWVHQHVNPIVQGIMEMEKPWVAAVNGAAAGAGCHLALACDLVVMAEEAYFYWAFTRRGLIVDVGGLYLLPRLVGLHKAKELAFLPEKIYGPQALELGLINKVVPTAELMKTVRDWAQKLAQGPTKALGWTKLGMNRGLSMNLEDVLAYEAQAQGLAVQTEDVREGVRAFLEKREPKFQGK